MPLNFSIKRINSLARLYSKTLIESAYPVCPNQENRTEWLPCSFDTVKVQQFLNRCKEEGVTFHSGFSSVIQAAVVKLLVEKCIPNETFNVAGLHCVDERHYFAIEGDKLGLFRGFIGVQLDMPRNSIDNFWTYAKQFNKIFKTEISNKASIDFEILSNTTNQLTMNSLKKKKVHYCSSNMKNCYSDELGRRRANISSDYLDYITNIRTSPALWTNSFYTYKDQLIHSIAYNSGYINKCTIEKLANAMSDVISYVTKSK